MRLFSRGRARARLRRLIARADAARDARDWPLAIDRYRAVIEAAPDDAGMHVQLGHSLKEQGRADEAILAYAHAAALRPADTEVQLHLGDLLRRRGRHAEAVQAFAAALTIDPGLRHARDVLLETGSRDLAASGDAAAAVALAGAVRGLEGAARALATWERDAARPPRDYDGFRAAYPVPPPPAPPTQAIAVRIDAGGCIPAALRATLLSLMDQSAPDWTADVFAEPALAEHSVGSFAAQDERVRFVDTDAPASAPDAGHVLLVDAGTVLDRHALAWFGHAAEAHDADMVYADHDALDAPGIGAGVRLAPRLYPMYDRDGMAAVAEPPLALLVRAGSVGPATGHEAGRRALLVAGAGGRIAHVPRILTGRLLLNRSILGGEDDLPPPRPLGPPTPIAETPTDATIGVIIQTRDMPGMLERAVDGLLATAARPDRIKVLVVDNRSTAPETAALFARWRERPGVRRLALDEPFNWSRANNLGLEAVRGDILVFANNDIEMLTEGWDDRLSGILARPEIGVVGARLLYPDRTLQHAGVLFGFGAGTPTHEGVGEPETAAGPLGRWRTRRAAAAVTGAFLAARRDTVTAAGGFDERHLPIGYSDLDLCLKVRAAGLTVLYEPDVLLVHHESASRGHNDRRTRLAWDQGESASFHARWGDEMLADPGYNPHWTRSGTPFDGYREPSQRQVLDHIARSARPHPWAAAEPEPNRRR